MRTPQWLRGLQRRLRRGRAVRVAIVGGDSFATDIYIAQLRWTAAQRVSLVAVVDANRRAPAGLPAGVPVFDGLDALLEAGTEVDLLLVADWSGPQAPLIRWALEQGWHVVCNEVLTDDPGEMQQLLVLARAVGVSLWAGLPDMFPTRLLAGRDRLGAVTRIESGWRRTLRTGANLEAPDPAELVEELLPRLLALALPYFGERRLLSVTSTIAGWAGTVVVEADGGAELVLSIDAGDGFFADPDVGSMTVYGGAGTITVETSLPLAEGYALQLQLGLDRVTRGDASVWAAPSPAVLAVIDAARRSKGVGGVAVTVS
jgi:predicted dehydrogenase